MLSMLQEFFDKTKDSRALFDGLAVAKDKALCEKWMNRFPVIFLSLSDIKASSFAETLDCFKLLAAKLCCQYSYLLESPSVDKLHKTVIAAVQNFTADKSMLRFILAMVCEAVYQDSGEAPIILIDEYDAPFAKIRPGEEYEELSDFLGTLFETGLKTNAHFTFAVLTGCLCLAKESIFTGLNNFACYGITNSKFADKFGFTSSEVDALLASINQTEKKEVLREWYDGYCFGTGQKIYCPWDILFYISKLKNNPTANPKAYWCNSSSNDIIRNFIDYVDTFHIWEKLSTLIQGGIIEERIVEDITYRDIYHEENIWTLMYLTGYLTKTSCAESINYEETTQLRIPNREVYTIFKYDFSMWFSTFSKRFDVSQLISSFWSGDEKTISQVITQLLMLNTSYLDGTHIGKEDFYHAFLLGMFCQTNYDLYSNLEKGKGRPDILINDPRSNRALIIEIKFSDDENALNENADIALKQIEEKHYALPLLAQKKTVYSWGLAFSLKTCLAKKAPVIKG